MLFICIYLYHIKHMGVSENVVYPIVPNGFADTLIPMKNGYFIGKINPTFSDKAIFKNGMSPEYLQNIPIVSHQKNHACLPSDTRLPDQDHRATPLVMGIQGATKTGETGRIVSVLWELPSGY